MDEILFAFIFSMLLELFSIIGFDKICIIVSTITLILVNYTCGLDKALVDVDTAVLWVILFYIVISKILYTAIYFCESNQKDYETGGGASDRTFDR